MTVAMRYSRISRILSGIIRRGRGRALLGSAVPACPPARHRAGVTLVELMVSLAILTIGIAGLAQSFSFIQKAMQSAKNKTLASNLAQEKMQILKQKVYYQILVTTDPAHNNTDFSPETLSYDTGFFPPEQVVEAGVTYTRYTYIQSIREDSGIIGELAPNLPDTGMKRITIAVTWGQGTGKRKVSLRSIIANPDTVMANVTFTGTVVTTDAVAISGVLVGLVESPGCTDTTNALGKYLMNGTPGTYTLTASATGYYAAQRSIVVAAGTALNTDFSLTRISTGRVEGYPWLKDHLVISQVVGSTIDASAAPDFDQEYIEIFNPTTYTWTLDGNIGLRFQRSEDITPKNIQINYINDEILSGSYYLFANTGSVAVGGEVVSADAVWAGGNPVSDFPFYAVQNNIIPVDEDGSDEGGGAIELYRISGGAALDRVGWNKTSYPAPFYEGNAIVQAIGLSRNELYARKSSTSDVSGVNWSYGPAYDSNNNNVDFYDYSSAIPVPPQTSGASPKTVIAGTPAVGAVASCSDGLSSAVEAASLGNPPYAYFSSVNVATGSWTVLITSGSYSLESSTVPVLLAGAVYSFPSSSTFLTQSDDRGMVSGRIVNVSGGAMNGIVVTSGGSNTTNTGADGRYRLRVSSGVVDITANPAVGGTAAYVTVSSNAIALSAGQVHSGVDFVLYQGGRVSGYITRDGVNGLPGVAVAILDANSVARDQQVSGVDGRFTSVVLSTGFYTAQPAIGSLETSSPAGSTVTILNIGSNHFTSTFTISGALGYITGTVKAGGEAIKTGVLIVVTTRTLTGTPPAPPDISVANLTGPPYYMVSSMENGTYLAEVRNSTNPKYNVYAYYPTPAGTSVTLVSSAAANVSVIAGQTTGGVNFSW